MIRNVDLLNFLPLFVQEYREIQAIMNAENTEIQKAENETETILNNQFIESCNSQGITRFEELLGITSNAGDSLQLRIQRVLEKWNEKTVNTYKTLQQKLDVLCGENNYEINLDNDKYEIEVITHFENESLLEQLDFLLDYMIPANMIIKTKNLKIFNLEGENELVGTIKDDLIINITE